MNNLKDISGQEHNDEEETTIRLFAEILCNLTLEEFRRKEKLHHSPEGFYFDQEGYTCIICKSAAFGVDSWYDNYGLKCSCCQEAINKKIIPLKIIKNSNSYYTECDLMALFNLKRNQINQLVKKGLLKDRVIPGKKSSGQHLRIFLISDNKGFLPPPSILRKNMVKEMGADGKEKFISYPWYYFSNPVKQIKKYGIATCLDICKGDLTKK